MPIGISFVTFEAISYLVDIYRKDAEPGSLLDVFTFLSFFPKLVSGPIILWKDFSRQLPERTVELAAVTNGIDRIIIGLAKKVIIADYFGERISAINSGIAVSGFDAPTMWLRALLYFFEIYYDFAGYSDIAIGLCQIFGFSVKENFNSPYISASISEFWRRWHISLGSWFREYIYIPLGGNRRGNVYVNLFVVFLLTGIWHGANNTFIIWGIMHGICSVIERMIRNKEWYRKTPAFLKWLVTMVIVFIGWIIFMSSGVKAAMKAIFALAGIGVSSNVNFGWQYFLTRKTMILLIAAAIGSVTGAFRLPETVRRWQGTNTYIIVKRVLLLALLVIDILFVVNSSYSPFIYFQF